MGPAPGSPTTHLRRLSLHRAFDSASDTQPTPTTVSLPAAQFVARHKPFVADFNVPQADNHDLAGRSFVVVVQNAEPVTRQRVNYALKELKERNLINVQYSTITVTDMHQLEVLSNSQ